MLSVMYSLIARGLFAKPQGREKLTKLLATMGS